jgi:hypothetical protein
MSREEWTKVYCRKCGEDMTDAYYGSTLTDNICSHECDCIDRGKPVTDANDLV